MTSRDPAPSWKRGIVAVLFIAVAALALAPVGLGVSTGITTGTQPALDPAHGGCTACHGDHKFATQDATVTVLITDAEGNRLNGPYEHEATYTLTITLDEQNVPEADNHAGFNLWTDAGTFALVDDQVQLAAGDQEATHTNPGNTEWTVEWTAPVEGPATFRLFVNDVDGSRAPDAPDQVYLQIFSLSDKEGAMPGAVAEEEAHVGVPLPQYWLGLLALLFVGLVMVFGFVYLKFVSPHNADQKDR